MTNPSHKTGEERWERCEYRVNDPRGIHGPFTDHDEAIRVQRECAATVDRQTMRAPVVEYREVGPWLDDEYDEPNEFPDCRPDEHPPSRCPTCGSDERGTCRALGRANSRHAHPIELSDKRVSEGGLPLDDARYCCGDTWHNPAPDPTPSSTADDTKIESLDHRASPDSPEGEEAGALTRLALHVDDDRVGLLPHPRGDYVEYAQARSSLDTALRERDDARRSLDLAAEAFEGLIEWGRKPRSARADADLERHLLRVADSFSSPPDTQTIGVQPTLVCGRCGRATERVYAKEAGALGVCHECLGGGESALIGDDFPAPE